MREIRANTETIVTIGPFVDVTDGFTPQTDITLGGDEAEIIKHGSTAVVSIAAATWAAVTSCRGHYSLTLTTSFTDTLGILEVVVQDDSDCLPVSRSFMVLSEYEFDRKYTARGAELGGVIAYGTAQSATATTLVMAAAEAFNADEMIGMTVTYWDDQGATGSRIIEDSETVADTLTVATWDTTPSGAISYLVTIGAPGVATAGALPKVNVQEWNGTVQDESFAGIQAALEDLYGITTSTVNDAAATTTGFTVTANVGADVRVGYLMLTSGTTAGEVCLVRHTGTTVLVLSDSSMDAAVKQYSAAPANSVTYKFFPMTS